jgi:phosphoserine phosphatase
MYLICDFDGTLVKNDFFEERFFKLLLEKPWLIIWYGFQKNGWLRLKHRLLDDYVPEYDSKLIWNHKIIDWIKENHKNYQATLLISASPDSFVKRIVEPMDIFDSVHGSLTINLKGVEKLRFIQKLGIKQFAYIGDSSADQPIFEAACQRYLVTSNDIKKLV